MILRSIIILCLCFIVSQDVAAMDEIDSVARYCAYQDYTAAGRLLGCLTKKNPADLDVVYWTLAMQQMRVVDYESWELDGDALAKTAESAAKLLDKSLRQCSSRDSVRCLFYLGNAWGCLAITQAKQGKWLAGVSTALSSLNNLSLCIKKDPTFLPAYLGSGLYKYYISNNLKWVPLLGNQVQDALTNIRMSTTADFPWDIAAKNSLCWVYIDRKEYRRVDSIADPVLAHYPNNTLFVRIKAQTALRSGNYADAILYGKRLIEQASTRSPMNWTDITCGYWICTSAYDAQRLGREVVVLSNEALNQNIPSRTLGLLYVQQHIASIKAIRSKYVMASLQAQ